MFGLIQGQCHNVWFDSRTASQCLVSFKDSVAMFGLIQGQHHKVWFDSRTASQCLV